MIFGRLQFNKKRVSVLVASAFIFSLISVAIVYADNFGREDCHGYFSNSGEECKGIWLPDNKYNVIEDGLPSDLDVSSKKFYEFVKDRYDNGSRQDKTGAAFIVNTMLGKSADGYGISLDPEGSRDRDDVWAEFRMKLDYIYKVGEVEWDKDYKICSKTGKTFTYYQPNYNDDAFYGLKESMVEDYYKDKGYSEKKIKKKVSDYCESKVLVFRDEDGDAIYRLNKDCANPVGDLSDDGLPAPKYELDPNVTLSHSGAVENSVDYIVTPSISNNGTVTRDTEWRLTKLTANSGNDISPDENSRSDRSPCSFYSSDRCETIKKGEAIFDTDGSVESKISGDDFSAYSSNTGDTPLGTEVCFVLSVKPWATHDPYRESDEEWRHSATRCFKIVKKPKVQILGGDLISGGKIQTSTSSKNIGGTTRMFGSWDEYAALAVGSISGIGSGAAFAGPGLVSQTVCRYSMLSFNNVDCSLSPSTLGNYSMSNLMPDIAATFPDNRSVFFNNTIVANDLVKDLSNGIYVRHHDGNLTLSQSELEPGKSLVLKVNGTVTISGNQTYNLDNNGSNYKSVAQLPQLLIIANNINIADAVTNIDAWLIVKNGYINTCSSNRGAPLVVGASLSAGICDRQLTFNGPVFTNKLYLRRTAGSGNGLDHSGDPAEVFNLRADAYLWSAARASSNGQVFSIKTIELPPRL